MDIGKKRKTGVFFAFLLFISTAVAQYSVTGGAKTPLQVVNVTRMQVFLVYGTENVQISYTSSSSEHQWFRYKMNALDDPEKVASTQNGTTSFITNVEDGYGYFVSEQVNVAYNNFVWIIDYSKYEFNIRSLNILSQYQCSFLRFNGDVVIPEMIYYTPSGLPEKIGREFEVSYETLKWDKEFENFSTVQFDTIFSTNLFTSSFPAPLKDTEITLSGDKFARHFGVTKSISILYQAVAVEVHADTVILSTGSSNMSNNGESDLLAPAVINFKANSNIPVASTFLWRILKIEEGDTSIVRDVYTDEMEHTFNTEGTFHVKLEVSSSACSNLEDDFEMRTFIIRITETEINVPNAFSPGTTPGINDIFKIQYKQVLNFKGWVYNRWGNELFHWTNPEQGWDGKYRGKYVAPGAYYYLIEYTGTNRKNYKKKGEINVFRSKSIDTEIRTDEPF